MRHELIVKGFLRLFREMLNQQIKLTTYRYKKTFFTILFNTAKKAYYITSINLTKSTTTLKKESRNI